MISDEIIEQVCKGLRGWDLIVREYDLPDGTSVYNIGFDMPDDDMPDITLPKGVVDPDGKIHTAISLSDEWFDLAKKTIGLDPVDVRHVPHES